eukprot:jgi/Mesen1/2628/ME000166S01750
MCHYGTCSLVLLVLLACHLQSTDALRDGRAGYYIQVRGKPSVVQRARAPGALSPRAAGQRLNFRSAAVTRYRAGISRSHDDILRQAGIPASKKFYR